MPESSHFSKTLRLIIGVAAAGLAIGTVHEWRALINSVGIAAIIALLASPLQNWLRHKRLPAMLAFLITVIAVIVVAAGLIGFMTLAFAQLIQALPRYYSRMGNLWEPVQPILTMMGVSEIDLATMSRIVQPGPFVAPLTKVASGIIGSISDIVVMIMAVGFLLLEALYLPAKLERLAQLDRARWARFSRFGNDIKRYVYIMALIGGVTGALDLILFLVIGVDFALLWALLAFLLSFIPILGFWLALAPPLVLALFESGPLPALIVLIGYILVNSFAESIVKPKAMGDGLNLSPAVVFLSLVFWTIVLGPAGMILAVPFTMVVKQLILEADERNRWLAELLSAERPETKSADSVPD